MDEWVSGCLGVSLVGCACGWANERGGGYGDWILNIGYWILELGRVGRRIRIRIRTKIGRCGAGLMVKVNERGFFVGSGGAGGSLEGGLMGMVMLMVMLMLIVMKILRHMYMWLTFP